MRVFPPRGGTQDVLFHAAAFVLAVRFGKMVERMA